MTTLEPKMTEDEFAEIARAFYRGEALEWFMAEDEFDMAEWIDHSHWDGLTPHILYRVKTIFNNAGE